MYDWSRDFILFREFLQRSNLWVLPTSGDRKAFAFDPAAFGQGNGRISPNGRWVAYESNESGTYQIVVQTFPSAAVGKWTVTKSGGGFVRWRRNDGRELFYLSPEGSIMAVPFNVKDKGASAEPVIGAEEKLFSVPIVGGYSRALGFGAQYDVSADGQQFLVNLETNRDSSITVVVNWPALLKTTAR